MPDTNSDIFLSAQEIGSKIFPLKCPLFMKRRFFELKCSALGEPCVDIVLHYVEIPGLETGDNYPANESLGPVSGEWHLPAITLTTIYSANRNYMISFKLIVFLYSRF